MKQWYAIMRKFLEIEEELKVFQKINEDLLAVHENDEMRDLYCVLYLYQKYVDCVSEEIGQALKEFDQCIVNNRLR
ncbi:MAG: hypothetical protein IJZ85_10880 [Lachnospiraceae bacterium]|nr:hypothetical protein [Lachnospiraceae bacterium]